MCIFLFFFFKQKTAYEMRISDWSSDVCSSDLDLALSRAVLNRSGIERRDGVLVERLLADPATRVLELRGDRAPVEPEVRSDDHEQREAHGELRQIGRASGRERGCQ